MRGLGPRLAALSRRQRLLLVAAALAAAGTIWFAVALPEPLFGSPLSPVLYARDGTLLGARRAADGQWRFPGAATLPARVAAALVRYEDRRFHGHLGVDPRAVARALRDNLAGRGVISGASTLTMQVVRLSRHNPPRTYPEKALEALLALRLEVALDKERILALYAQHAPFGGNVVGLETAAWRYFGRSAADLSWAEAATLAVLPNSPGLIHPGRSRAQLQRKRDRLLDALHADGLLDELDLRLALAEPLPGLPRPWPMLAPHLLDTLAARHGARRFDSTLDAALQARLALALVPEVEALAARGVDNAAVLVVDHQRLEVVAYFGNLHAAQSGADGIAIDLAQRPRSTGSILKPLLFALLLQDGRITPRSLVPDVPTQIAGYIPENYDRQHRGAVPADEALALSLNVPAVRLLREFGVARFHAALRRMGFSSLFRDAEGYGLTLVLGGAEATPWDVATAYANLAAIARAPNATPRYRPLALLRDGAPGEARPAEFGPGAAFLTLTALAEVNRPGVENYWRNFASSREVAWKTGTSFGLRDAWAVGSVPSHTVAVWAGDAVGGGIAKLSGTDSAAPLLFAVLNQLPDAGWFAEPAEDLAWIEVCRDDGHLVREDCAAQRLAMPRGSHYERPSPYHQRIHLDPTGRWRVHAGCEAVGRMQARGWFQLPAVMEHYYRRAHPQYRPLPRWRADCVAGAPRDDASAIGLLYPQEGTWVLVPVEIGGERSQVVFEAVHRRAGATIHWHLDDGYLGSTRDFHQLLVDPRPGSHRLTLVDEDGRRLTRRFTVMSKHQ